MSTAEAQRRAKANYVKNHPERRKATWLKDNIVRHGMTVDEYQAMLEAQSYSCAICDDEAWESGNSGGRLYIDHDHATNKVRALLCARCNSGLGQFKDDPELLAKAKAYLERFR